jgi:iron complex transport system ATP-binding protein
VTLEVRELSVRYGSHVALAPTSFALHPGELVALIGPNGAVKSSLLKALAGLMPHSGTVAWRGAALASFEARERARTVAFLPQTPVLHWPMRVRDLVALGRLPHRGYGAAPSGAAEVAIDWAMEESETFG